MTDKPIELDRHPGTQLIAAPSVDWAEAAEKVRYVLRLYVATLATEDTRGRALVEAMLGGYGASCRQAVSDLALTRSGGRGGCRNWLKGRRSQIDR